MGTQPRVRSSADYSAYVPVHVIWEITLACDLKCLHCGSRAGHRRPNELSTAECLDVVDALYALGTREVSLIGGEAYLRNDWTSIIAAISAHGMYCGVQTGGRNLTPKKLEDAIAAGLGGLGVSLDGMEELHDRVRGVSGAFRQATTLLDSARALGVNTSVNTQIGPETLTDLPVLLEHIAQHGVKQWQLQLTVAMGNAVDNPEYILQPYRLLELMPLLARLHGEALSKGVLMVVGNNIGYFGPYEHLWRGYDDERLHWSGCTAGHTALALEADGTIKGCPSLPTVGYAGGNIRDRSLQEIWNTSPEIHFSRSRNTDELWGECRACYYADVCRAGCTWTAHSLLGRPGNNPYCHYRALRLHSNGYRERIVKVRDADDRPFAVGEFDLITERIEDDTVVDRASYHPPLYQIQKVTNSDVGRIPPQLLLCKSCFCYIYEPEKICPHCAKDVAESERDYVKRMSERQILLDQLRTMIASASADETPIQAT